MEKVRIFQDMLEYLYALTPPTRKFVKKYFSKIDADWFNKYVYKETKNKNYRTDYSLSSMDLSKLINSMLNNWGDLKRNYPNEKKFNDYNLELLEKVIKVRNHVAHLNEKHYKAKKDMDKDVETLKEYANFLGASLSEYVKRMYEEENESILKILFDVTTDQALAIENELPEDIANSIKRTRHRLSEMKSTSEIIEFLKTALDSTRGKQVAEEIHKHNLKSFEDIADEIFESYYGFVKG